MSRQLSCEAVRNVDGSLFVRLLLSSNHHEGCRICESGQTLEFGWLSLSTVAL